MQKKWIATLIIASICVATIGGLGIYYFIINSDDDDDNGGSDSLLSSDMIIDHNCAHLGDLKSIPEQWITNAKNDLHILYWHTSHGSQLTSGGMANLDTFMGISSLYTYNNGGTGGALDIEEFSSDLTSDTDNFHFTTEIYLDNPSYSDVNVVMWSWCGLDTDFAQIDEYLTNMNLLETNYSTGGSKGRTASNAVRFVYMTGHLDGSGESGAVHLANERIRDYCIKHNKILYDFADIESYNPNNEYFLDRGANDNCDYDGGNWATEWQSSHDGTHTEPYGGEWYDCSPAHTQPLNGNLKAYGAWYLFARLAGWNANPNDDLDFLN